MSANGVNSLDFATSTLILESGLPAIYCGVAPTVELTITTVSNNRPLHLLVESDRIYWKNTDSSHIPQIYASAEAYLQITLIVSTPFVSQTLTIDRFPLRVSPTSKVSCLTTHTSLLP